eukprot:1177641-Pyramimonas_sp.AAC.1
MQRSSAARQAANLRQRGSCIAQAVGNASFFLLLPTRPLAHRGEPRAITTLHVARVSCDAVVPLASEQQSRRVRRCRAGPRCD